MKSTEEVIDLLINRGDDGDVNDAVKRLKELMKDREEMVQALQCCRSALLVRGVTSWEFAWMCKINPIILSKWTATKPTTEPDFVD